MNDNFTLTIKDFFKLSNGSTAIVGAMEPQNYPTITLNNFIVKITNSINGDTHIFDNISEDIFSRANPLQKNEYRAFQTTDNIDKFIESDTTIISGCKK